MSTVTKKVMDGGPVDVSAVELAVNNRGLAYAPKMVVEGRDTVDVYTSSSSGPNPHIWLECRDEGGEALIHLTLAEVEQLISHLEAVRSYRSWIEAH